MINIEKMLYGFTLVDFKIENYVDDFLYIKIYTSYKIKTENGERNGDMFVTSLDLGLLNIKPCAVDKLKFIKNCKSGKYDKRIKQYIRCEIKEYLANEEFKKIISK